MKYLDTRLLQVFDEIYKTRSVSRAAEQLDLGQSIVSLDLGKLRRHFGDPLFVRTSTGMDPTPLGEELVHPIRHAIEALEIALQHRSSFDAAKVQRVFRIAMTDISQIVLLPRLWERLHKIAPGIQVEVVNLSLETPHMLEIGTADLAIGFIPQLDAGFYKQKLFDQKYVCLSSVDHPRIRDKLSLAQFKTEQHAIVVSPGTGHRYLDSELLRQNIQRKIVLQVPNFLGLAFVVEYTDLIVTVPSRLAEMLSKHGRFRIHRAPFDNIDFTVNQFWHERFHRDLGNLWLRSLVWELLGNHR